jgi:hypothetical protein
MEWWPETLPHSMNNYFIISRNSIANAASYPHSCPQNKIRSRQALSASIYADFIKEALRINQHFGAEA